MDRQNRFRVESILLCATLALVSCSIGLARATLWRLPEPVLKRSLALVHPGICRSAGNANASIAKLAASRHAHGYVLHQPGQKPSDTVYVTDTADSWVQLENAVHSQDQQAFNDLIYNADLYYIHDGAKIRLLGKLTDQGYSIAHIKVLSGKYAGQSFYTNPDFVEAI